jgi:hypothetical protein
VTNPVDELHTETADDAETVVVSWLKPLLAEGHVANARRSGAPLPYYLVTHLDSTENVDESTAEALVSVHVLTHKAAGEVASRDEADRMHRRMLLLARYLDDVELADGRVATIDFVNVAKSPSREEYGDDTILRRVGRYSLGLSYAEVQ